MRYIAVVGSPGSGKTTFSRKLLKKYPNSGLISCGDLYRNHSNEPQYKFLKNAKTESKESWIQALKKFVIMALSEEIAHFSDKETVIVDGLWQDNIGPFIDQFGKIETVYYIECNYETAYHRLLNRGRSDDYPMKIASRCHRYFDNEHLFLNCLESHKLNIHFIQ